MRLTSHLSKILYSLIFTVVESECDKYCNKHIKRYLTIPIVHLPGEKANGKDPFVFAFPFASIQGEKTHSLMHMSGIIVMAIYHKRRGRDCRRNRYKHLVTTDHEPSKMTFKRASSLNYSDWTIIVRLRSVQPPHTSSRETLKANVIYINVMFISYWKVLKV